MGDQPKDQPPMYNQQTYQTTQGYTVPHPPTTQGYTDPNPHSTQGYTDPNPQMFGSGSISQPLHQVEIGSSDTRITTRMSSEEEEDIYRVDGNVKVGFEDVFPEPSAYDKLAPVRNILSLTYHYVQLGLYGFLMVTVGMFLTVWWALAFGLLNFFNIWFIQPFIKAMFVLMRAYAVVFRAATRAFCDPCWSSMGLALANMRGRFKLGVTGVQAPNSQSSERQDV